METGVGVTEANGSFTLLFPDLEVAKDQEEPCESGNAELADKPEGHSLSLASVPVVNVFVVAVVVTGIAILDLDLKDSQVNAAEGNKTNDEDSQDSSADAGLLVKLSAEVLHHDFSVVDAEDPNEGRNLGNTESEERNCAHVVLGDTAIIGEVTIICLIGEPDIVGAGCQDTQPGDEHDAEGGENSRGVGVQHLFHFVGNFALIDHNNEQLNGAETNENFCGSQLLAGNSLARLEIGIL